MINVSVSGFEEAKRQLAEQLKNLITDKTVLVGIHEDAGSVEGEDLTMAQLGAILHFGTQTSPARPWLDVGVESGSEDYAEALESHGDDLDNALEIIGQIAVGKVQQYMTDLQDPPNARSTIKAKGSSNPLIDTGATRSSVTYSISPSRPDEGLR